jgi:hypothetical protein
MNRQALIDRTIRRTLAGPYDDLQKGLIDEEKFASLAQHRMPLIRDQLREAFAQRRQTRCGCGQPATTRIAGADYCSLCAHGTARLERPGSVG